MHQVMTISSCSHLTFKTDAICGMLRFLGCSWKTLMTIMQLQQYITHSPTQLNFSHSNSFSLHADILTLFKFKWGPTKRNIFWIEVLILVCSPLLSLNEVLCIVGQTSPDHLPKAAASKKDYSGSLTALAQVYWRAASGLSALPTQTDCSSWFHCLLTRWHIQAPQSLATCAHKAYD